MDRPVPAKLSGLKLSTNAKKDLNAVCSSPTRQPSKIWRWELVQAVGVPLAGRPGPRLAALPPRRLAPACPSLLPGRTRSRRARSAFPARHGPSGPPRPQAHPEHTAEYHGPGSGGRDPGVANSPRLSAEGDPNVPFRKTPPALPPLLPAAIFLLPRRLLLTPWPAPPRCSRGMGAARREGSSRRVAGLGQDRPRGALPAGRAPTQKRACRGLTGGGEAHGLGCFSSGAYRGP